LRMSKSQTCMGLDVGEKRIGVAVADTGVKIAVPLLAIEVDGSEIEEISKIYDQQEAQAVVVGYPRNQSGAATAQTKLVEAFADKLKQKLENVVFQDESVTSVIAEEQLAAHKRPYTKGDIDAQAAAVILQDYMEINHAS